MMNSAQKTFFFRICTVAISLVFILGMTEIFFRIFRPIKTTASMGVADPVFHHILQSNMTRVDDGGDFRIIYHINKEGFRGKSYPVDKPPKTYRIVILGDSFTFGSGVSDGQTFSDYLENILNENFKDRNYEVINCGIGSYSPILEYLLLKNKAIEYSPALVMLFYDFSDLQEDLVYGKRAIYDTKGELVACNPLYINGHPDYINILKKYSYFFSFVHNRLSTAIYRIKLLGLKEYIFCHLKGIRTKVRIRQRSDLGDIESDRYIVFREHKDKKIIQNYWKNSEIWLNKIRDYLKERNIDFILVAYPYGLQVSATAWSEGRLLWQFEPNKLYDSPAPFEMFYGYSRKNNVKFINLRDYLIKYSQEELYYSLDGHWTPLGNRRVAEGIFNNPIFRSSVSKE